MKSKSVWIAAAFMAIILFAGTSAFGQAPAGTATFLAIDDSTELAGRTMDFSVNLTFVDADSLFGADSGWVFFTAADSAFEEMNSDHGLKQDSLLVYGTGGIVQAGQGGVTEQYDSKVHIYNEYNEGDTVYIYATLPFISDSVLAVSEGFVVLHQPIVDPGTPITPSAGDTILNSGGIDSLIVTTINLEYAVIDVDDAEPDVPVWIFLDEIGSLTKDDFTADPVSFGTNSILISPEQDSTGALDRSYTDFMFDIVKYVGNVVQTYTAKGDYYVYLVAYDGKNANIGRSADILTVKHAPSIGTFGLLDRPVGNDSINTANQQMITINWTSSGDTDIDDEAMIGIWMDEASAAHQVPSDLMASGTRKDVTGGFIINEQGDEISDDQYVWNLRTVLSANLPESDSTYVFYALIRDERDTILAKSDTVKFTHYPKVEYLFNPGTGVGKTEDAGVSQITIDNGQVFRVNFNAFDLDQNQYIRMFISQLDSAGNYYAELAADVGASTALMNSTDGTVANVELLTTGDSYLNWYSGNMTGLTTNGNYYIYAFITKDGTQNWTNANTDRFIAPGKLRLTGRERTALPSWDMRIIPDFVHTNKGDSIRFDVVLDSKGGNVEQVAFYLDVDTSLFEIVDPANPFKYNATDFFFGSESPLENTSAVNGDKIELNFMKFQYPGAIATDTLLTYFEVVAKDNDSSGTTTSEILFANTGERFPRLTSDGASRTIPVPTPAVNVVHNPLGRILGRIPLQGRENFSKVITMEIREIGSLNPIDDSYFNNNNDDPNYTGVNGVQVVTDRDGFFELMKIPTGTYQLVARTGGYLSGQYSIINVLPGNILVGVDPTYDNDLNDQVELKGGDVSSGNEVAQQDGVVDGDDINFLVTNYNLVVTGGHPYEIGDINGNGIISHGDLFIASANYGLSGIPPLGNKFSGGQNNSAKIVLDGTPEVTFENQEFTVFVSAENVDDLLGFVFTIQYDADKITLVEDGAIREGDFLQTRSGSTETIFFNRATDDGILVFGSLLGNNGDRVSGSGTIANLTFCSLADDIHPEISLMKVKIANSEAEIRGLGDVVQVPGEYSLSPNYPNPFNPETKIRFELPKASHVTLKIYNMLGQEVMTLVNGDKKAGYHVVNWNGKNQFGHPVASGVYFYRIVTPEFSKTMKMLLIK